MADATQRRITSSCRSRSEAQEQPHDTIQLEDDINEGDVPVVLEHRFQIVLQSELRAQMVADEAQLRTLGRAFDRAWDRFLQTGMLTARNLATSRELLAKYVIEAGLAGETDEWRLARLAFGAFWEREVGGPVPVPLRSARRRRSVAPPRGA